MSSKVNMKDEKLNYKILNLKKASKEMKWSERFELRVKEKK